MRIQEVNFSVAIYGPSRTGKSAIAEELAVRTGLEARHCGDLVSIRSQRLGLDSVSALPQFEHRQIDAETARMVSSGPPLIVEGRYLDQVLSGFRNVLFVALTCEEAVRANRANARHEDAGGDEMPIARSDRSDAAFRAQVYGRNCSLTHWHTKIDTTNRSISNCASEIYLALSERS
jgi:cytidylate kinase